VTGPSDDLFGRNHRSLWGDVWTQFRKHKLALVGTFVLIGLILMSFIGPLIYHVDPTDIDITATNSPPSCEHPFGTDNLGRDTLARVMFGGRVSLSVGIFAVLVAITVGTLIGALAGYFTRLDGPLMRLTDIFLALPLLPLLLVTIMLFRDTFRTAFGPEMGIFILIVFVIGILNWTATARVVRGQTLSVKEQEFIIRAGVHHLGDLRRCQSAPHPVPPHLSQYPKSRHRGGHSGCGRRDSDRVVPFVPGTRFSSRLSHLGQSVILRKRLSSIDPVCRSLARPVYLINRIERQLCRRRSPGRSGSQDPQGLATSIRLNESRPGSPAAPSS
jgi:hypothetical protein